MSYAYLLANDFGTKLNTDHANESDEKKSFAREIAEKNKEIREQHRIIIQESIEEQATSAPKNSKKHKEAKDDKNVAQ